MTLLAALPNLRTNNLKGIGATLTAEAVVEELKSEVDADPEASNRRIRAAKERAARERGERVQVA